MCRRREERFQSCQTSGRDYKAPRCIHMRLVMEMWYACMFVCVNVWWYKHILLYVFIFIHLYIYIYILSCIFISIMCYLICFGSDLFCIYLRGIVLGMISRFQSAKSSVHQATKVSRQNKKKTSEATDLQETQLGAKSLKSAENLQTCFLGSLHHIIALSGYREGLLHKILYQGNESPWVVKQRWQDINTCFIMVAYTRHREDDSMNM